MKYKISIGFFLSVLFLALFLCSCGPESIHGDGSVSIEIRSGKLDYDTLSLIHLDVRENNCSVNNINATVNGKSVTNNDTIVICLGDSAECCVSFDCDWDYRDTIVHHEYCDKVVMPYPLHIISPTPGDTITHGEDIFVNWKYDSLNPSKVEIIWNSGGAIGNYTFSGDTTSFTIVGSEQGRRGDVDCWTFRITVEGWNEKTCAYACCVDKISMIMKK